MEASIQPIHLSINQAIHRWRSTVLFCCFVCFGPAVVALYEFSYVAYSACDQRRLLVVVQHVVSVKVVSVVLGLVCLSLCYDRLNMRGPSASACGLTLVYVFSAAAAAVANPNQCRSLKTNKKCSEDLPSVNLGLVHPPRQLEIPPRQPCVLGAERLRLGRIPQGAVLSRVVSIRNCLTTSVSVFRCYWAHWNSMVVYCVVLPAGE